MSVKCPHAVNVIFDMGTEDDVVFHFLRSGQYPAGFSKNEKRALDAKLKTITKWRRMPCFIALEVVVVGKVCHALPEGIQL